MQENAVSRKSRSKFFPKINCLLSTHSLSVPGGAWQGRRSVGQWAHNSLLTRWSLSCSSLNKYGCLSSHSSPWRWRRGTPMGVRSVATMRASRNRIGACPVVLRLGRTWLSASFVGGIFLFLPWLVRLVGFPNGRVAADGSPGRTDDGRVIRDVELKPTAREVWGQKAVSRAVYFSSSPKKKKHLLHLLAHHKDRFT